MTPGSKSEQWNRKPSHNTLMLETITSCSHRKRSEEIVCPSWTAQYTLKKKEASTMRWTENLHTQIRTFCSTLIIHGSTSGGTLNHRLRPCPLSQKGRRSYRSTSGEHLKPVATQIGPLSKLLKDPEQTEMMKWEKVTLSFLMLQEHLRNSGGSLINRHLTPIRHNIMTTCLMLCWSPFCFQNSPDLKRHGLH